jgi:hypothetical protein
MSTPRPPRPLPLTDADREVWAEYEYRNRKAAAMYAVLPIASFRARLEEDTARPFHDCTVCGTPTRARLDKCRGCARVEREAGA